jgi:hypothetical protein
MSNTQQAEANSERPIRPSGVLVNFPAPRVDPSAWPADDLAVGSSRSLHDGPRQEFPLSYSEETQWDDQSFLDPPRSNPDAVPSPVLSDDASSESPDPGLFQQSSTPADAQPHPHQADEILVPPVAPVQPKRSWLERWLFPDTSEQDKRGGERKPAPGLIAHFWTGGPPKSQPVRDISATGMYVVTDERWYLGTQIRITLTKALDDGSKSGKSITVMATAARWGDDGVGLEFVRNDGAKTRRPEPLPSEGADGKQLGQFVEQFGATSNPRPGSRRKPKR